MAEIRHLHASIDEQRRAIERMGRFDGGGGGGYDDRMEARVAKLENAVEYIQRDIKELKDDVRSMRGDIHSIRTTDFRIFFGALIAVALGLAGIMAKGFHWL